MNDARLAGYKEKARGMRSVDACLMCLLPDVVIELVAEVERLEDERLAIQQNERALTCAFCGHVYPPGTPASNHAALRDHVAVCPQHPATQFRFECERHPEDLRAAFVAGAKWWEYHSTKFTMWQSDQHLAMAEALKRWPEVIG